MKIAICDDVKEDLDKIEEIIKETRLFKAAECLRFDSGEALLREVEKGEYFDFILLDINMPGINGIETGKQITEIIPSTILIFVTGYIEYALDAFDCNAYHYILKSESYEKFFDVLSKAKARWLSRKKRYSVRTKGGVTYILLEDIKYVEYVDKHLAFHTDKGVFEERGQIGHLADKLEDFGFIRVHQGYIVNSKHVKSIQKDTVTLTDGTRVMMSMKKRGEVVRKYKSLTK